MGILKGCKPRREVLKGDLDDAIFAADFGDLLSKKSPKVYGDAKTFFQNTHPAKPLCKVIESVFGRLAAPKEGGATIRLSTGFGGGKTHTLMALWHLASNIGNSKLGTDLLPAAGRPSSVTIAAIDAKQAGHPIFTRHGNLQIKSLWGELAYQLAGNSGLKQIRDSDDAEKQPSEAVLEKLFPKKPVLILLDELVIYMATLSERGQGNLLAFLNKLLSIVGKRPKTVLVVTDPADQRAYAQQAAKIGDSLSAAIKLDDIFGRRVADFDPIGDETAQVIVRRLFEKVDTPTAQSASKIYHDLYDRIHQENPGTIPASAVGPEYAKRIVQCYPFHPRLVETAQGRLGALQEFNKSRGTLRLFARILRSIWEAKEDLELIAAGDIDFSSDRIQADLLHRLNKDSFMAAVSSDIEKKAVALDGGKPRGIHVRVASALLLESIPMHTNSGMDKAELTLATVRPDEAGDEPSEAMDRLAGVCWHTYPMPGGRGWQFRYDPNVIKQIEERMGQISIEDAKSRALAEAQGYFSGAAFKMMNWPQSARQVSESATLQLVLCEDERVAKSVCAYQDDTDPNAPIPRRFQNAILAITASSSALSSTIDRGQRLLAAEAIEREHKTGESGKLVREQLSRIKPELLKQFRIQTCRAFDKVVLPGNMVYSLEEKFQVPEEQMLRRPHGQECLKRFLDEKGLIYQPTDALDVNRFIKDILPGTTPIPDKPGVYHAKAIHERFLGSPGLRLIPDGAIVRQTILKAVEKGKVVVKLEDNRAYDSKGCVEGTEGNRRRTSGSLTTLSLDDSVLVAMADSDAAKEWTKVDDGKKKEDKPDLPPPPPSGKITVTEWDKIIENAEKRPLLEFRLSTRKSAPASSLSALAQPLGAEKLSLTVTVTGTLKDGGDISFQANDVKPTHPTKPLNMAQTLFNALAEGDYEANLNLTFGAEGRIGMESQLKAIAESASDEVEPYAVFDKPTEESK